ncbi:hypothetical protein [Kocuria tytonicola]|nr:hypothetical protein [Kocuria tytonicola]
MSSIVESRPVGGLSPTRAEGSSLHVTHAFVWFHAASVIVVPTA